MHDKRLQELWSFSHELSCPSGSSEHFSTNVGFRLFASKLFPKGVRAPSEVRTNATLAFNRPRDTLQRDYSPYEDRDRFNFATTEI